MAAKPDFHTQILRESADVIRRSRALLAETEPVVRRYARNPQPPKPSASSAGPDGPASSDETERRSRTKKRGDGSGRP